MKKLFGISLVAALAVSPMMANAAAGDVNKDPGAKQTGLTADQEAAITAAAPKYATMGTGSNDNKPASAGYVKGAYNAVIKGVNAVQGEFDTVNTKVTTQMATQEGVEATLKKATSTDGSLSNTSVSISSLTPTAATGDSIADITLKMDILDEWGSNTLAADDKKPSATATFGTLTAAPTAVTLDEGSTHSGTVTKTGITQTVDANSVSYTTTVSGV